MRKEIKKMRSINEIVEGLNGILCSLADIGCMTDEEIEEWGSIMCDYRIWEEVNKVGQ